jgi:hypothetical protein
MEKTKITISYELQSKSENIIWPLISTSDGMKKWIADEVELEDNKFSFTWGDPMKAHEKRHADIIALTKGKAIRMRWCDEEDPAYFWEISMVRNEITGTYHLEITDYAEVGDEEYIESLWNHNYKRLHASTGL